MPCYDYRCDCGHEFETFRSMRDENPEPCPVCKGTDTARVPSLPHSDLNAYFKPIEMFSVAVNSVEEAIELRDKCPDADVNVDINHPDFGLPIARTRKAKLQVLAASGMRERN